jgi:hypothetical protein
MKRKEPALPRSNATVQIKETSLARLVALAHSRTDAAGDDRGLSYDLPP